MLQIVTIAYFKRGNSVSGGNSLFALALPFIKRGPKQLACQRGQPLHQPWPATAVCNERIAG
ncbi:hypothetical protein SBV1_1130021 [Verrucomicrobia bacterium]|nr:hypothetical protein SBV1_1130021 [Verrucomicrobiota bacterium]